MDKHLPNGEAMADKDHREHYTVSSDIPVRLRYRPENLGGEMGADTVELQAKEALS
jgi:hypothetical protein